MLRWARDTAGVSIEAAAKRVTVKPDRLVEWERKKSGKVPTVRQARKLADCYNVAFLEFFRTEPPALSDPELIPDFRLFATAPDPSSEIGLKRIQLWAETQRVNALDLFTEIGEQVPDIPDAIFVDIKADPEQAAADTRTGIKFPIEEQVGRNTEERRQIPTELRRKIEALGILILRRTDLGSFRVRGFCIAEFPLPIIVIGKEAPTAEAFTLVHEFAHVLIRQSAISGAMPREGGDQAKRKVEEWCNRFASAFLMPRNAIAQFIELPDTPLDEISDDLLHRLARHFGVSPHAMLVRLIQIGCVAADYYWRVKKPQYDEEETEFKSFGRSPYYGSRFKNRQGELYTGLVLEAWSTGRITSHHAAEYMGIKNIGHMYDIRDHYGK